MPRTSNAASATAIGRRTRVRKLASVSKPLPDVTVTVKVIRVLKGYDMRGFHARRKKYNVSPGEVVLCINKSERIVRLYDCGGHVHNYYADKGMEWSANAMQVAAAGLGFFLEVDANQWAKKE